MGLLDQIGQSTVRYPASKNVAIIALSGTTDGSGNLTLSSGLTDVQSAVTKSGNNYIIDVGPFVAVLSCIARSSSSLASAPTINAAAGTVQINFGTSQNNASVNIVIVVDTGAWR
jgi:hypothetical protein